QAAMMMRIPRITAPATIAAATLRCSRISLLKSPGVHLSNALKPTMAAKIPTAANNRTLPMAWGNVCACQEGTGTGWLSAARSEEAEAMTHKTNTAKRNAFILAASLLLIDIPVNYNNRNSLERQTTQTLPERRPPVGLRRFGDRGP